MKELIEGCRPKGPLDDNATSVSWYHAWLCRWTFFAYPDAEIRDSALEMTLERQWKR